MVIQGKIIAQEKINNPNLESPYLTIDWSVIEQDVVNNRSKVSFFIYLEVEKDVSSAFTTYGSGNYSIGGSSSYFTQRFTITEPRRYLLLMREVWVNHNSSSYTYLDVSAYYTLDTMINGVFYQRITISGMINIPPAFSKSTLTNVYLSRSGTLVTNSDNFIYYNIEGYNSSYRYRLNLRTSSGLSVTSWEEPTGLSSGLDRNMKLPDSAIEYILSKTSGETDTLVLYLETLKDGKAVGSLSDYSVDYSLHPDIKPKIKRFITSIAGDGKDKDLDKYIQSYSKSFYVIEYEVTAGSSVSSIEVEYLPRIGDGNYIYTHYPSSGYMILGYTGVLANSGTYDVKVKITDSRGREATHEETIYVHQYTPPVLRNFQGNRQEADKKLIDLTGQIYFTPLDGDNTLNYKIEIETSGITEVYEEGTLTDLSEFNYEVIKTLSHENELLSHKITYTVSDLFRGPISASVTVGSAFYELTISRGRGVGIGKVHETGSLDVDGAVSIGREDYQGNLIPVHMSLLFDDRRTGLIRVRSNGENTFYIGNRTPNGHMFTIEGLTEYSRINLKSPSVHLDTKNLLVDGQFLYRDGEYLIGGGESGIHSSGVTTNGGWIRFSDGTQICYKKNDSRTVSANTYTNYYWFFPVEFTSPVVALTNSRPATGSVSAYKVTSKIMIATSKYCMVNVYNDRDSNDTVYTTNIAIGRWK